MDKAGKRLAHNNVRPGEDLVKHHYNRRGLVGPQSMLFRKSHPMSWKQVNGNYQTWELNALALAPTDAESAHGEPTKLFYSDDLAIWVSRRKESMPYFFRNCDADEVHLISRGQMTYETDFGEIEVSERELLVIPKGVTYRVLMRSKESLRIIYESEPEMLLVPVESIEEYYNTERAALEEAKLVRPQLPGGERPKGEFEVRVKYRGAFADFLGEITTFRFDHYPLDVEIIDGFVPVFKFSASDVARFPGTPAPFLQGAYLDNKERCAWTMHLAGGGGGGIRGTPVHRDPDIDELRYNSSGPAMGTFLFTPHGADHGWGRGYTKKERNRPQDDYDLGDVVSAYTIKPLKGTSDSFKYVRSSTAG
jgi:homogentisate 1,2-dioxygenase